MSMLMTTLIQKTAPRLALSLTFKAVRLFAIPVFAAGLSLLLTFSLYAQDTLENGWRYQVESIPTGANEGFQLALDRFAGRVYVADAEWRIEKRDEQGDVWLQRTASGKLVVFDSTNRSLIGIHSYLDLNRADGSGTERNALDWAGVTNDGQDALSSMRSTFSPYGVAVDGTTIGADGKPDATIITTTARAQDARLGYGGHVVIYQASQGGPVDADRLWQFEDGTPFAENMRRVVVNTQTHKAYITNMGEFGQAAERRPGFIAVIDLPSKTVEARVPLPDNIAAISAAVDETNNLVYVAPLNAESLFVFDAGKVDAASPKDFTLNSALMKPLQHAKVGKNARPEYDPHTRRLYVATFDEPKGKISVVDADPTSPTYGTVLQSIETGQTNALTVDGQRGLLLSANLGDKEVVVHALTNYSGSAAAYTNLGRANQHRS